MSVIDDIMQEINSASRRMRTNEIPSKYYRAIGTRKVEEIIRRNLNGKDTDVPAKDGWIPVDERLPEEKEWKAYNKQFNCIYLKRLELAYKTDTVEYIHGYYDGQKWIDKRHNIVKNVVAWRIHEPYRPERSDNHDGE